MIMHEILKKDLASSLSTKEGARDLNAHENGSHLSSCFRCCGFPVAYFLLHESHAPYGFWTSNQIHIALYFPNSFLRCWRVCVTRMRLCALDIWTTAPHTPIISNGWSIYTSPFDSAWRWWSKGREHGILQATQAPKTEHETVWGANLEVISLWMSFKNS